MAKARRFLVMESNCMNCDDTNRYFLVFHRDGSVTMDYEGCGGYQGQKAGVRGKNVERLEAIKQLRGCLRVLKSNRDKLEKQIKKFEDFLKDEIA